jgi:NDP-sugar pyrophosphorylase family protein
MPKIAAAVTAVVLAGGHGDRIGPIGRLLPKGLLPVSHSETLLSRTLRQLGEAGIPRVIVSTSPDQYSLLAAFVERSSAILHGDEEIDTRIEVIRNPSHEWGPVAAFGEALTGVTRGKVLMCLGDIWCTPNPYGGLLAAGLESGSALTVVPAMWTEALARGGAAYLRNGLVLRLCETVRTAPPIPEAEVHLWIGAALLDVPFWTQAIEYASRIERAGPYPTEEDMLNHLIDAGCRFAASTVDEFVNVNRISDLARLLVASPV